MTHALTLRLDDDLAEQLRTAAFRRRCAVSDIIRDALRDHLAALDPAEQPTTVAPPVERCAHCGKPLNGLGLTDTGEKVCHTGTLPPYAHPTDCYRLVLAGEPLGARDLRTFREQLADKLIDTHTANRHQPLTDEPCGHVPTQQGLDYLRDRRQQHPHEAL